VNTAHFFDLYGKLLKTYEDEASYEMFRNGMFVELDIKDALWSGTIEKINHFPPDPNGNEVVHIFIYNFKPKYSEFKEEDE